MGGKKLTMSNNNVFVSLGVYVGWNIIQLGKVTFTNSNVLHPVNDELTVVHLYDTQQNSLYLAAESNQLLVYAAT